MMNPVTFHIINYNYHIFPFLISTRPSVNGGRKGHSFPNKILLVSSIAGSSYFPAKIMLIGIYKQEWHVI